jgi:hypothetical protein
MSNHALQRSDKGRKEAKIVFSANLNKKSFMENLFTFIFSRIEPSEKASFVSDVIGIQWVHSRL